ncbi:putative thioredoxin [Insectomime virus]|nr:putative thioredoxin [Insectomime virus]
MTLYLTSKDFTVRGSLLNVNSASGNVLVFFKKGNCRFCSTFEPVFQACAENEPRIEWAIVDLDRSPEVIQKSRQTKNPIKTVPYIVMFINGVMKAIYTNKDRSMHSVLGFVNEILNMSGVVGMRTNAVQRQQPQNPQTSFIQQRHQQQQQAPSYQSVSQPEQGQVSLGADYVPYNIPWASDITN